MSGSSVLDATAKSIIDKEVSNIPTFMPGAYIRVEGNTDNVGSREDNIPLSKLRAQSVIDYLVNTHHRPPNQFLVTGNGPDKPVDTNDTEDGRAHNRRTDIKVLPSHGGEGTAGRKL